jgi:hypothetical protein
MAYCVDSRNKFVVKDNVEGPGWDQVFPPAFTPDGRRLLYVGVRNDKAVLMDEGAEIAARDWINYKTVRLSQDCRRLAYGAKAGKKWLMVVDGKSGSEYEGVSLPVFDATGRHVAYTSSKGGRSVVVFDGEPAAEYDLIVPPGIAFDSDHGLRYLAVHDKTLFHVRAVPAAR